MVPNESVRQALPRLSRVAPKASVLYMLPSEPLVVPNESVRQALP